MVVPLFTFNPHFHCCILSCKAQFKSGLGSLNQLILTKVYKKLFNVFIRSVREN